jgi:hypothetical protein
MQNHKSTFSFILWLMRVTCAVLVILTSSGVLVSAWLQPIHSLGGRQHQQALHNSAHQQRYSMIEHLKTTTIPVAQHMTRKNEPVSSSGVKKSVSLLSSSFLDSVRTVFVATAFLSVSWWCASIPLLPAMDHSNVNLNMMANAKEMASGSGSRVNKDPESLLRYGLPIQNKEVNFCVFST